MGGELNGGSALPRRDGELPEDYAERCALHRLAAEPPGARREMLYNRLIKDARYVRELQAGRFWADGEHIDRERTGLDGAGFAEVQVVEGPFAETAPAADELLMDLEESNGVPPGAYEGLAALLRDLLDWLFAHGDWGHVGEVARRVFKVAWYACPDLMDGYCDDTVSLLVRAPSDARRCLIFDDGRVRRAGLCFTMDGRRPMPPDLPRLRALGIGEPVHHPDVLRGMLEAWFAPVGARRAHHAPPATVVRRVFATAYTVRPDLVRGQTLEQLASWLKMGRSTMQWLNQELCKKRGLVGRNTRGRS